MTKNKRIRQKITDNLVSAINGAQIDFEKRLELPTLPAAVSVNNVLIASLAGRCAIMLGRSQQDANALSTRISEVIHEWWKGETPST